MFWIEGNASLTLGNNITLRGRNTADNMSLVLLDGTLTMQNGSLITGHILQPANDGGGVNVREGGTLIMNGGEISGNYANTGGGVLVRYGGTFTMNNGTISGNHAGVGGGGGVFVGAGGTFNMSGGTISGNTAASNPGSGVAVAGDFNMTNGTIYGNEAEEGGGGVYIVWNTAGSFRISGGTIHGTDESNPNTAGNGTGAALLVDSGTSGTIQHGTFAGGDPTGTFTSQGTLVTSELTIEVVNGELFRPAAGGSGTTHNAETAAQLIAALDPVTGAQSGDTINITANITLTVPVTISAGVTVVVNNGIILRADTGCIITVHGSIVGVGSSATQVFINTGSITGATNFHNSGGVAFPPDAIPSGFSYMWTGVGWSHGS